MTEIPPLHLFCLLTLLLHCILHYLAKFFCQPVLLPGIMGNSSSQQALVNLGGELEGLLLENRRDRPLNLSLPFGLGGIDRLERIYTLSLKCAALVLDRAGSVGYGAFVRALPFLFVAQRTQIFALRIKQLL